MNQAAIPGADMRRRGDTLLPWGRRAIPEAGREERGGSWNAHTDPRGRLFVREG